MKRLPCWIRTSGLCLAISVATPISPHGAEPDIRRDATVNAVDKAVPSVVNVSTETIIESRGHLNDLFREFFDPYYGERHLIPPIA